MKKLLILQNMVPHYRKSLYNALSRHYEVTVLHSGSPSVGPEDVYREIVRPAKRMGPFFVQSGVLPEVRASGYDAIVAMFDVRWLMNILAMWIHARGSRFIWWGVWFGKSRVANRLKLFLSRRGKPIVFYDADERGRFLNSGVPGEFLYVAHNTFHVPDREPCYEHPRKDAILFVGTLDQRKQVDVLVRAFASLIPEIRREIRLVLVGWGSEGARLKTLVEELGIGSRVEFKGRIDDPATLAAFYRNALASVSFGQAGLSVLQSLAFGVPFVTKQNAISGGEKNNIMDRFNGVLCEDNQASLEASLRRLCLDLAWARQLGKNAFEYYSEHCTMDVMVSGFQAAIEGRVPA